MRCTWGKGDTKEDLTALMMHPTLAIAAGGKEQEEEEEEEEEEGRRRRREKFFFINFLDTKVIGS